MFSHAQHKQKFVSLHRYFGLTIALFLVVSGLTGSVLAYYHELDEWLNPDLFFTEQKGNHFLQEDYLYRAAQKYTESHGGTLNTMSLEFVSGRSLRLYVNGSEEFNRLFINPYTAEVMGARQWGDLSDSWRNIAGFIYKLHYTLWLPGSWGVLLLGIIALIWTLDCFVAVATTLPIMKRFSWKLFCQRWKQSFKMRWKSKGYTFHFLLHRSAGLWLWALLLIFAWSSVAFNLRDVYKPVTYAVFQAPPETPSTGHTLTPLPFQQALSMARAHAESIASEYKVSLGHERSFRYLKAKNTFQYRFHSSRDVDDAIARSVIYIDAATGEFLDVYWPTGQYSGTTVTQWLYALHMAEVFGRPYQLLVCLLGLMVTYFSYSGVKIWWRKRQKARTKRRATKARAPH